MAGPWSVRTRKPKGNVRLNWAHPLAKSIAFLYYETAVGTFYDAVTGKLAGTVAGQTITSQGTLVFNGSAKSSTTTAVRTLSDTTHAAVQSGSVFVIARCKLTAKPAVKCAPIFYGNGSGTRGCYVAFDTNGFAGGGETTTNGMIADFDAVDHLNKWVVLAGWGDTSGLSHGYVDGVPNATTGSGSASAVTVDRVTMGRDDSPYFDNFTGEIDWAAGFNRIPTNTEIKLLSANIWQLLLPTTNVSFFSLPSGTVAYTLAAASGAYVITGVAAKLAATRALAAAPGAYVISGAAANLTYTTSGSTYTLAAASGSYLISGVATNPAVQRKLSLASGSYAITGAAAALTATRALAAVAGAYAITGAAAKLTSTRALSLAPGSYAITGAAAKTGAQRQLTAAAGSYFVTGAAAALSQTRAYVLQANPGSYFISGRGADLNYSGALSNTSDEYVVRARRTERR